MRSAPPAIALTHRDVRQGELGSFYKLVVAGCVIVLLCYAPLLIRAAGSWEVNPEARALSKKISLNRASDEGQTGSTGLRYVDLNAAEEGRGPKNSEVLDKGDYKAYSNPYAQENTAGVDSIQPVLMPKVRAGLQPDDRAIVVGTECSACEPCRLPCRARRIWLR